MYTPVFWKDRIVEYPRRVSVENLGNGLYNWIPAPGEIVERGTAQSERNFGKMDSGILEDSLITGFLSMNLRLVQEALDSVCGQTIQTTLNNTLKFPATNAEKTIVLPKVANKTDYTVEIEVLEADGPVENVEVYEKALNAFKICYSGSARNVFLKLHVVGG